MRTRGSISLLLSAIAALLMVIVMRWQGSTLVLPNTPSGILALEFANTPEKLSYVLSFWNKSSVQLNIYLDFLFIAAYVWFFVVASAVSSTKWHWVGMQFLGKSCIRLAFLAAILDIVENVLMLQSVSGDYNSYSLYLTWYCAVIKFGIVTLILSYIIITVIKNLINRKNINGK